MRSISRLVQKNWITRRPSQSAARIAQASSLVLIVTTALYHSDIPLASKLAASGNSVFVEKELWRPWTALLVHADLGHLLSNLFLFFPFAYLLSAYFSWLLFPLSAFFLCGASNLYTLSRLPPQTTLLGVSGVVHWMGAAWITLSILIDRRDSATKRALKAVGVTLVLFIPQAYRPEVSYMSHILGYGLGVLSGAIYYWLHQKEFLAAEKTLHYPSKDWIGEQWQRGWIIDARFSPLSNPHPLMRYRPESVRSSQTKASK
jgi:rhomboid protease GluP